MISKKRMQQKGTGKIHWLSTVLSSEYLL